jgi:GH24 family phage-related lysozyme (muramidase)
MNFWDEVGSLIQAAANRPGHQGVLDTVKIWKEERKRIEKLRFWDEVKGKHGFPQDIKVWHVHPLAWVENFICKSGICFDQYFEYQTTKGVFRVSEKLAEKIHIWEGYKPHPYRPGGASGVTIGIGYDLGQQSVTQIRTDLNGIFNTNDINRLVTVAELQGQQAQTALSTVSNINVSLEQAKRLAIVTFRRYVQKVVDVYPDVLEFHPDCQGALLSLVINRGNSFTVPSVEARIEMRQIQDDFRNNTPENIPRRIVRMKRLWMNAQGQPISSDVAGLLPRRDEEAAFFERGLSCTCFKRK